MSRLLLTLSPTLTLSDEQFVQLCQCNPDVRLERTSAGDLVVMPPTGSDTGAYNTGINAQLWFWNQQTQMGVVFDLSTGFRLPNGVVRSPDAAWIQRDRWDALSERDRQGFAPLCPDVVIELVSPSDDVQLLRAKMQEYLDNGARLGWLIHLSAQTADIYRPERSPQSVQLPAQLSDDQILPGFALSL